MNDDKFGQPVDYLTGKQLVEGVYYNLAQQVIITSADKLYRPLQEWKESLERRDSWLGYLGIFLALLLAVVTTDTKPMFGLSKDVWSALFIFSTFGAGGLTVYSLVKLSKKCLTIDDLIARIRDSRLGNNAKLLEQLSVLSVNNTDVKPSSNNP